MISNSKDIYLCYGSAGNCIRLRVAIFMKCSYYKSLMAFKNNQSGKLRRKLKVAKAYIPYFIYFHI